MLQIECPRRAYPLLGKSLDPWHGIVFSPLLVLMACARVRLHFEMEARVMPNFHLAATPLMSAPRSQPMECIKCELEKICRQGLELFLALTLTWSRQCRRYQGCLS